MDNIMNSVMQGAQMYLQAQGIKDKREQTKLLNQLQQMQMQNEQIRQYQLMDKISAEQQGRQRQQAFQGEIQQAFAPQPVEGGSYFERDIPAPGQEAQSYIQKTLPIMAKYPEQPAPAFVEMAQELMPKEKAWHPGSMNEAIEFEKQKAALKSQQTLGGYDTQEEAMAAIPDTPGYYKAPYQDLKTGKWRARPIPMAGNMPVGYDAAGNPIIMPSRGSGGAEIRPSPSPVLPKPAAITQSGMEDLTQGIQALRDLNIMEKNVSATGGIGGIGSKILLNVPIVKAFNLTTQSAQAFETARNRIRLSAQSMIKGIPSNYDVQIVLDTLADLAISPETNIQRLRQTREAYTSILKDTISFHKGSNQVIPTFIINSAKSQGIDINSIPAWDGQSDPFQNTANQYLSKGGIQPSTGKTPVRRGRVTSGPNAGKTVIEYSDGSRAYE